MKPLKALISKNTMHRAHIAYRIPLKKSELQDGDLCMQHDGSVGIYNSEANFKAFSLRGDATKQTLIFYTPGHSTYSDFVHYSTKYYTDDLEDKDDEEEYDVIMIIRGLFDPKDVNDSEKVKEFLKNESNYKNYFV